MGPLNAVRDLWKQQYEDWVNELIQYTNEDNGNLTAEHQTILDQKDKARQQTEATYVQIANNTQNLIIEALAIVVAGATAFGLGKAVIDKWRSKGEGQVQTAKGQSYIMICMLAEDLVNKGYPTQATALVTTMQNRFNNIDAPYMQAQITYYQSQLPTLVGWELLYAQYMINAYQVELAAIPMWFQALPPPILAEVKA